MSSWTTAGSWLLHSGAGGGLLLLLTCFLMSRARQPALRQRLGEWGLAAALVVAVLSLVGPAWLIVEWPAAARAATVPAPLPLDVVFAEDLPPPDAEPAAHPQDAPPSEPATAITDGPAAPWWQTLAVGVLPWVVAVYALGAAFLLGRWLLAHLALLRLLRRATPAPPEVARLFAAMTAGPRRPRLLVSRRVRVPVSCGLLRPTVVLPASMCERPAPRRLRWVFAHELTHLERRDSWSAVLFALGQVVYFLLPWFWWQRRQVRLCQEYVADAAAAGQEPAADYAEFLLSLTGAPAAPRAATGVSGPTSDLFRRVRMLLQQPVRVEKRCPRRWSLAAGSALCALAVVLAGVGLRAEAAPQVIIIIPQDKDAKADAQKVRVLVVPDAEQEHEPGTVLMLRAGHAANPVPGQPPQENMQIRGIFRLPPDKAGTGTEAALQALRKALADLEKTKAPVDADAVPKVIDKALFWLKKTQDSKAEPPQGIKFKIKVEGATPMKELHEALDALRKVLKELEKKGGAIDAEAVRKEAVKALHYLGQKGVVTKPVPLQPSDKLRQPAQWQIELKVPKAHLEKVREALKNHPEAAELLKALEAWEGAQKKAPDGGKLQWQLVPGVKGEAIPDTKVKVFGDKVVRFTKPAALGLQVEKPSSALADQLDLPKGQGLLITGVAAGSPAAKAGLKANDVLLSVSKTAVPSDPAALPELLKKLGGKGGLDVEVLRKGKRETIKGLKLAETTPHEPRLYYQPAGAAGRLYYQPAEALLWKPGTTAGRQGDVMTTLFRNGDRFNTRYQEGSLIITLTGSAADGKAQVAEIVIQDGAVTHKYDSAARVPAQYRDKVNHLLEISARGQFRTERK